MRLMVLVSGLPLFIPALTWGKESDNGILLEVGDKVGVISECWGGDFNNIGSNEEKKGGRRRLENSFKDFRTFIGDM